MLVVGLSLLPIGLLQARASFEWRSRVAAPTPRLDWVEPQLPPSIDDLEIEDDRLVPVG